MAQAGGGVIRAPAGILDWAAVAFVGVCMLTFAWVAVHVVLEEVRDWRRERRYGGYLFDREKERLP